MEGMVGGECEVAAHGEVQPLGASRRAPCGICTGEAQEVEKTEACVVAQLCAELCTGEEVGGMAGGDDVLTPNGEVEPLQAPPSVP